MATSDICTAGSALRPTTPTAENTGEEGATAQNDAGTACVRGKPSRVTPVQQCYEVVVDHAEVALSEMAKARAVLKSVCSITGKYITYCLNKNPHMSKSLQWCSSLVPSGLLVQAHKEDMPSYATTVNSHTPGHFLHLNSSSTRLERSIAREAGRISSTFSKAKGSIAGKES